MTTSQYKIITAVDNPELLDKAHNNVGGEWPEFMLHDPVANLLDDCYTMLPKYQFVLVDETTDETVALGNTVPLSYDGELSQLPDEGWDWALTKGIDDLRQGAKPTVLCALQVVVFGDNRGKGISSQAVEAMKQLGQTASLNGLIAPVRPSQKSDYPLIDIANYIRWQNDNNEPFDSWLRVHAKLGARIIKPCPKAMRIDGTIEQWSDWTSLSFKESGKYIVNGALVPVDIDVEADRGVYLEPNVWMHHPA